MRKLRSIGAQKALLQIWLTFQKLLAPPTPGDNAGQVQTFVNAPDKLSKTQDLSLPQLKCLKVTPPGRPTVEHSNLAVRNLEG